MCAEAHHVVADTLAFRGNHPRGAHESRDLQVRLRASRRVLAALCHRLSRKPAL